MTSSVSDNFVKVGTVPLIQVGNFFDRVNNDYSVHRLNVSALIDYSQEVSEYILCDCSSLNWKESTVYLKQKEMMIEKQLPVFKLSFFCSGQHLHAVRRAKRKCTAELRMIVYANDLSKCTFFFRNAAMHKNVISYELFNKEYLKNLRTKKLDSSYTLRTSTMAILRMFKDRQGVRDEVYKTHTYTDFVKLLELENEELSDTDCIPRWRFPSRNSYNSRRKRWLQIDKKIERAEDEFAKKKTDLENRKRYFLNYLENKYKDVKTSDVVNLNDMKVVEDSGFLQNLKKAEFGFTEVGYLCTQKEEDLILDPKHKRMCLHVP